MISVVQLVSDMSEGGSLPLSSLAYSRQCCLTGGWPPITTLLITLFLLTAIEPRCCCSSANFASLTLIFFLIVHLFCHLELSHDRLLPSFALLSPNLSLYAFSRHPNFR